MSIAFSAVLLFVLVLPGIILHYTYSRGPWRWGNPTSMGSLADEVAFSVTFAAGLHCFWLWVVGRLGYQADFDALLILLLGVNEQEGGYLARTVAAVTSRPVAILFYFVSLYLVAAVIGWLGHIVVRALRLDRRTRLFRFKNDWFYLLTGEVLEFSENPLEHREYDGVYLSAVVEVAGQSYLYRGIVTDFTFDRAGTLDRIVLRGAHRRAMTDDTPRSTSVIPLDSRYHEIRGDFFVLRYAETKTINLDYFALDPVSGEVPLPQEG